MSYTIGVDIGGTKIATAIMNQDCNLLYREEVPSKPLEKEAMLNQVILSIEKVLTKSGLNINDMKGIGVGVPGKVDRENGIAVFQNNLPWRNFPLAERLKDYFSIDHVTVDNDVYMATFAEWNMHGAVDNETFVYITISTGISCSIIHQGEFIRGAGFAGEVGLLPVKAPSFPDCLARLEQAASGPAIKQMMHKDNLTTAAILELYKQNNPDAETVISNMTHSIAHGCYIICCLLDPHKIVFGGGVMNHHPYLLDQIQQKMDALLIPEQMEILNGMYVSKLQGDSGIIGAGLRGLS